MPIKDLYDKGLKQLHDHYYKKWIDLPDEFADYDDFILDLLNEIEDFYNPSRLNGN